MGQAEDVIGTKTSKTFSYGAAGVAPWDMVGEGSIDMQRGAMGAVSIRPMQQLSVEDPEPPPHVDDLDEARSPERSESDDIENLQETRRRKMAQARAAADSRTNPANPDLQPNPAERPSERAPSFAAGGVAPWDTIW